MRIRSSTCLVGFCLGSALLFSNTGVHAQTRIALKSGESTTLGPVYSVRNCASIMVGDPEVQVLKRIVPPNVEIEEAALLALSR
jgi:hypothetical protein